MNNPEPATLNFFNLLKTKLLASKYHISHIKKLGIHYQIDFYKKDSLEHIKKFLEKDTNALMSVVDITRIRTPIKNFEKPTKFLQYLLLLFEAKNTNPKIKIKKK